jgi:hypothetical protein
VASKLNFHGAKSFKKQSGMPNVSNALSNWCAEITLKKITSTWDRGENIETFSNIVFLGVTQPLNPKQIALKPEGQRAWQWLQIHSFSGPLDLNTNDRVEIDNNNYKIMAISDYSRNGYIEYHAVRDYD